MVDRYSSYTRGQETENPSQFFYCSHHSDSPSFSSTLLDTIYRSIDQGEDRTDMVIYRETMRKKQSNYTSHDTNVPGAALFKTEEEMANFQRACMIEKWMEKKVGEKAVVRRKSAGDTQVKKSRKDREANSSSSSSDSSSGGGGGFFSSSEADFPVPRPKPVRTGGVGNGRRDLENRVMEQKPKDEGGFLKTKSRALKIYADLKKVKQPISPGGKLAGFLNSFFSGGNLKKTNKPTENSGDYSPSLKSGNTSTCSSASSFSRSCLSKTPSSMGKSSNGGKRSVRFSPVSVIVDEHCQPCGHKSLTSEEIKSVEKKRQISNFDLPKNNKEVRNSINDELMVHIMDKNRRVEEIARELLRKYQKKNQEFSFDDDLRKTHVKNHVFDQEFEEDEDDAASYASSDLFELDNLSAIGMERYREELPVYETTHLDRNRAIANGFIL